MDELFCKLFSGPLAILNMTWGHWSRHRVTDLGKWSPKQNTLENECFFRWRVYLLFTNGASVTKVVWTFSRKDVRDVKISRFPICMGSKEANKSIVIKNSQADWPACLWKATRYSHVLYGFPYINCNYWHNIDLSTAVQCFSTFIQCAFITPVSMHCVAVSSYCTCNA